WIDVGGVGTLTLSRLERHLRATEIGRLSSPGRFYDFTRYRPRSLMNEGKREFNVPNTIIRHAEMAEGPDLLLVHLLEPHLYGEEYVETMLEVFEHLGVKKYSLIGAMYDMVPHTRPLILSGCGVGLGADEENANMNVKSSNYEGPTTITYLIGQGVAKKGIDTRIYVVHLPQYFQVEEDLYGTSRLMEIMCRLYSLPDRLIESDRGRDQYESLQKMFEEESEVSNLLLRLEEKYDKDNQESDISLGPLSQDIEEFLRGLDEEP
ncbi:MAG: PAC2 family protein, partial [Dehalococcoidia bacterium]|nr:PAC2 family protein [Dehalococcoidia bacterium]